MDFKDRQREAMRLAARIESKAAEANSEAKSAGGKEWEANSEAKSAGGKEWEPEFLFFYRCHTSLGGMLFKMENITGGSVVEEWEISGYRGRDGGRSIILKR